MPSLTLPRTSRFALGERLEFWLVLSLLAHLPFARLGATERPPALTGAARAAAGFVAVPVDLLAPRAPDPVEEQSERSAPPEEPAPRADPVVVHEQPKPRPAAPARPKAQRERPPKPPKPTVSVASSVAPLPRDGEGTGVGSDLERGAFEVLVHTEKLKAHPLGARVERMLEGVAWGKLPAANRELLSLYVSVPARFAEALSLALPSELLWLRASVESSAAGGISIELSAGTSTPEFARSSSEALVRALRARDGVEHVELEPHGKRISGKLGLTERGALDLLERLTQHDQSLARADHDRRMRP